MSRYRQEANADTRVDLDPGFIGVNAKVEPSLLRTGHAFYDINRELAGPGIVSHAVNCRFESGTVSTRRGSITAACYTPDVTGLTYYGTGEFSDPNGRHWLLCAASDGVHQLGDGTTPSRKIALPDGVTIDGPVDLVQSFDSVILFRGDGVTAENAQPPLVWDGNIGTAFTEITATAEGDYTSPIPNAATAVVFGGRLYCASARDQVAVSDLLEYTRWDATLNTFRLNAGESDSIVALHPYRRNNLLVFKERSIHVLANTYGDLSDVRAELINGDLGCVAAGSVASVGSDVFFLAATGVYRLGEIVENSMATQEIPVSDPIEPLIERINTAHIHKAQAIVFGKYYRLAVPLDGSIGNSHTLVYDTTTGQWQGYDYGDGAVFRYQRLLWGGREYAAAISGYKARVSLLDAAHGSSAEYNTEVTTRGYVLGAAGIKRFRNVNFALETQNPRLNFYAQTEGQNEIEALAENSTRSRTRYTTWGTPDYDITNVNGDDAAPHREDYTVELEASGSLEVTGYSVDLERLQSWTVGFPVRRVGRWISFKIVNDRGVMTLKTVTADATVIPNHQRASG